MVFAWCAIAMSARPQLRSPTFFSGADRLAPNPAFWLLRGLVWMAFGALVFFEPDVPTTVSMIGTIASLAVLGGFYALDDRRDRRTLATVLGKPTSPRTHAGGWTVLEGVIEDPTPVKVAGNAAALAVSVRYDKGIGSSPDIETSRKFLNQEWFVIRAEDGSVVVDPNEIVWATTVHVSEEHGLQASFEAWIPVGGKVAACGMIERDGDGTNGTLRLRARGTTPAVVFATSKEGRPRPYARASVRGHMLTTAVLFLAAAIEVGLWGLAMYDRL
jgi:hypothetical protein